MIKVLIVDDIPETRDHLTKLLSFEEGIDVAALAIQMQRDGANAFVKSWQDLLARIADKSAELAPR